MRFNYSSKTSMMRTIALLLLMTVIVTAGCNSSKKTTDTMTTDQGKALLLDGTWEANYILPQSGKSFNDLFPKVKPTVTFNSVTGVLSGISGCNNFNGKFTVDGNKISIPKEMASTRKMCAEGMDGEKAFLETLPKVNGWSVTDRNTLNLLQGDMAVMRLVRK